MNYLTKRLIAALPVVLWLSATAFAQEQADRQPSTEGKIHIELRKEENGESKTFSRDYNSREEMQADKELSRFLGEEKLQLHFFGGEEADAQHFTFNLKDEVSNSVHVFSNIDSLMSFKMAGPGMFHFQGSGGDDKYVFRMLDGADKNAVWSFGDGDSLEMTFELDSSREAWKDGMLTESGFRLAWESNDEKGMRQIRLMGKKVTISKLEAGEESLDKLASKKTTALDPVSIRYYPNPSSGRFTIDLELAGTAAFEVSIVDLSGKVIHEEEVRAFDGKYTREFDLSEKPAGIYLLQVVQGSSRLVRKIMIN